jgi:plastocyanin
MRIARLTLVVVLCVAGVNLAACSKASSGSRTIEVDYNFDDFTGSFLGYFPRSVTVRPGMTLKFHQTWTGAPHSVPFGAALDEKIKPILDLLEKTPNGERVQPPPAFDAAYFSTTLPTFFRGGKVAQDAAQPCFVKSIDALPLDHSACSKKDQVQPDFDGTYAYYSSGLIRPEGASANRFEVKIASDARDGTYFYYCNLHGLTMSGFVNVAKGAKVQSHRAMHEVGRAEAKAVAAPLLAEYRKERAGTSIYTGNLAGSGDPSTQGIAAEINEFTPETINATIGQKVTWTFVGNHSISFNVPAFTPLFSQEKDGTIVPTEGLDKPAGGWPGAPPGHKSYPFISDKKVSLDAGTFDGSGGLRSSGIGFNTGDTYAVTFTKKGTYPYACLIHPGMIGKVVVK